MSEKPPLVLREVQDEFSVLLGWMIAAPEGWTPETTNEGFFVVHKEGRPSYVLKVDPNTGLTDWSVLGGPREQFNLATGALQ